MNTDTKGWIPTHRGRRRVRDGAIMDPFVRDADMAGPLPKPYLPFFTKLSEARAWCWRLGAVPIDCEYSEAQRVARRCGVELRVGHDTTNSAGKPAPAEH